MINYNRLKLEIISFIISVIFFFIVYLSQTMIFYEISINNENLIQENNIISQNIVSKKDEVNEVNEDNWILEIPAIDLKGYISEGTDENTMNEYIGHFEETALIDGNVCLAAHNRGYPVNYFQNIRKLKQGDEILYQYRR